MYGKTYHRAVIQLKTDKMLSELSGIIVRLSKFMQVCRLRQNYEIYETEQQCRFITLLTDTRCRGDLG